MAKQVSSKRALIDQANTTMVILTSVAAFIFVFCAIATKTLAGQAAYQNRVISGKKTAVAQLKTDISAVDSLKNSYAAFTGTTQNVLGGNTTGTGPQDGNNAKIVLDALPSSYDFPALTTSLEKLMLTQNVQIQSITGTDDEVAQSSNTSSATPTAVPIPFSFGVQGDYPSVQGLIGTFEKSIRPIQVQAIDLTAGNNGVLTLSVTAQTYYQPAKSLNISKTVVK